MTLEIEGLDRPKTAKVADKIKQKLPQIRLPQRVIFSNGNGASKCDPPHDWLDDPLVALQRKRGPYTFENADEYLDTEAVELYNGWLVQQEMSDIKERGFAGTLHDNMSSSARLLNFGQALPDLVECLLDDGNVIKPDVCLISWQRMNDWVQPHGPRDRSTLMGCPELVVEIRSPSNRRVQEEAKRERYFANGAQVVWDVDEKKQIIYVYRAESPEESETYTTDDVIDCEPFLPGWCRQVSDLFDDEASVETVLGEVVDAFREEGEKIGLEEGEKVGKKIGLEEGEKIGEQRGKKIGLEEGEKIGEQRGKKIGLEEGEKIGEQRGKKIGLEEGEKIGEQRGVAIGKQDTLIRLLEARFPDLPEPTLETIRQTHDLELLDAWFDRALVAQGLDEIMFGQSEK